MSMQPTSISLLSIRQLGWSLCCVPAADFGVMPLLVSRGGHKLQVDFSDGDSIRQDPRREDPLIYYLPAGEWSRAIGMKILPSYEEHEAKSVIIRFWEDHLASLQLMSDSELVLIIQRYAHTLSKWFSRWKDLTIEFPDWLVVRVGENAILQTFVDAGWQLQSKDINSFQWKR
jgi:hypothetical protein